MKAELLLEKITERIDESARETREYVDATVKASAQETREYVDATVKASAQETREYVDAAVKGLHGEVDAALADQTNQLLAVIESSQHPIKMIADGHDMLRKRVEELAAKTGGLEEKVLHVEVAVAALRTEMRAGDAALREELAALRTEVRNEFAEVRRMARIESAVSDLSARVGRLEERAGA